MKTIVILFFTLLFLGFGMPEDKAVPNVNGADELFCPDPPTFSEFVSSSPGSNKTTGSGQDAIDEAWYSKAVQQIAKDEYNISYSRDLDAYQSPNRKNNIRFVYHSNGFTAKTRSNKIPMFDVNDMTLMKEDMKYETIDEWKLKMAIDAAEWGLEGKEVRVEGNTAHVENEMIRIQYLNNEEGMRQDFIIKQKPAGKGKLKLAVNVETKLKMIAGADALVFKNSKGEEKMKYTSLKVWDAEGRSLRAYFEKNSNSGFSIVVNDEGAVYPVTIDPLSTTASWTVTGEQQEDLFGRSAATAGDVNGDGYSDVVIGAQKYDNTHTKGGRGYVYNGSAALTDPVRYLLITVHLRVSLPGPHGHTHIQLKTAALVTRYLQQGI